MTYCDVVYLFPPTTTSHRGGDMFPIFTDQLRDAPVNCSSFLLLRLYFFFSSVFIRGLTHAGSLEDIVTVLRGKHLSVKEISFASSRETTASTFVEFNTPFQSSEDKEDTIFVFGVLCNRGLFPFDGPD